MSYLTIPHIVNFNWQNALFVRSIFCHTFCLNTNYNTGNCISILSRKYCMLTYLEIGRKVESIIRQFDSQGHLNEVCVIICIIRFIFNLCCIIQIVKILYYNLCLFWERAFQELIKKEICLFYFCFPPYNLKKTYFYSSVHTP